MTTSTSRQNHDLLVDSGANVSMTNDKTLLWDYQESECERHVTSSNGEQSRVEGQGSLHMPQHNVTITNVLYVPKLTKTLIATKSLTEQGLVVCIDDKMTICNRQGNPIIETKERNGLYYIPAELVNRLEENSTITLQQAHKRFGHASTERLQHLPSASEGIKISTDDREFCDTCAFAKSRRAPFPGERRTRQTRIFEIMTSDLKGPLLVESSEGYRYFITFNCL